MLIDEAQICLVAGRGGDGIISFRREKYVPKGGPNGGDGGAGGDIYLEASPHIRTLIDFTDTIHWKADKGGHGGPNNRRGKKAKPLVIKVPIGTVVRHLQSQEFLADLMEPGQRVLLARGGEGGRGNNHFKSSSRQAPRIREKGEWGEELWVKLELKLLADVGLIGSPNAGKSTLLSQISAKRPKIGAYPFTTLEPNLGVVSYGEFSSFVAVDVPGLIEGAHEGKGLGDRFLKHIERTRLLVHMVDISDWNLNDPVEEYHAINHELGSFSPKLTERPQIVVGNKIDLIDEAQRQEIVERFKAIDVDLHLISAATGEGVPELVQHCGRVFEELMASEPPYPHFDEEPEPEWKVFRPEGDRRNFRVIRDEEGFIVAGEAASRLSRLSLEELDAPEYLQEQLERLGLFSALKREGVEEGDMIKIGDKEFEYEP